MYCLWCSMWFQLCLPSSRIYTLITKGGEYTNSNKKIYYISTKEISMWPKSRFTQGKIEGHLWCCPWARPLEALEYYKTIPLDVDYTCNARIAQVLVIWKDNNTLDPNLSDRRLRGMISLFLFRWYLSPLGYVC